MTHRSCDKIASEVFGSLGNASPVKVFVFPQGEILDLLISMDVWKKVDDLIDKASRKTHYDVKRACSRSIYNDKDKKKKLNKIDVYNAISIKGFELLRKLAGMERYEVTGLSSNAIKYIMGSCGENELSKKFNEIIQDNSSENLRLLLTIPRFFLAAMGSRNLFNIQPLPPGHSIEIRIEPRSSDSRAKASLAAVVIAATLVFLGVGKAATRGFGRYKLIEFGGGMDKNAEEILEDMRNISELNKIYQILNKISKLINNNISENMNSRDIQNRLLPYFGDPTIYSGRTVHPLPFHLHEVYNYIKSDRYFIRNYIKNKLNCIKINDMTQRVLCQLSAIGMATLKWVWKIYLSLYNDYLFNLKKLKRPGTDLHTWALGLPRSQRGMGYYMAGVKDGYGKRNSNDLCIIYNDIEEIRLPSQLILFPLGSETVLLEPEPNSIIYLFSNVIKEKNNEIAVHIGKHKNKHKRVISILDITKNEKIPSTCLPTSNRDYHDPGGIRYPNINEYRLAENEKDAARKVLEASEEWLKKLLDLK